MKADGLKARIPEALIIAALSGGLGFAISQTKSGAVMNERQARLEARIDQVEGTVDEMHPRQK